MTDLFRDHPRENNQVWLYVSMLHFSGGGGFGFLSGLKSLVGSKTLTRADIEPTLVKMKDHLIGKFPHLTYMCFYIHFVFYILCYQKPVWWLFCTFGFGRFGLNLCLSCGWLVDITCPVSILSILDHFKPVHFTRPAVSLTCHWMNDLLNDLLFQARMSRQRLQRNFVIQLHLNLKEKCLEHLVVS